MPCESIHYLTHVRPQFTSPFSFLIRRLKSLPSRQIKSSPGWMMPHLAAMALAVLMLSPVTIRTVMPARWHLRMASGTWEEKRRTKWKVTLKMHTGITFWGSRSVHYRHCQLETRAFCGLIPQVEQGPLSQPQWCRSAQSLSPPHSPIQALDWTAGHGTQCR